MNCIYALSSLLTRKLETQSRVLSGAFWLSLSNLASRGLLMIAMMLTARMLGSVNFGELGIIQSSITLFESVAALGMGMTATRHIAEYRKGNPQKIGKIVNLTQKVNLTSGIGLALLMYFSSQWLAESLLHLPQLTYSLQISALILLLNTISGGLNGILAGFEAFREMATVNAVTGIVTIVSIVSGAYYYSVIGAVAGLAASAMVNTFICNALVNRILKRQNLKASGKLSRNEWRLLLSFSFPAMLAGLIVAPVNWGINVLIVNHAGTTEMGLYAAANQWFSILLFIPGIFTSVYFPIISNQISDGFNSALKKTIRNGLKTAIYTAIPGTLIVLIGSPWIMGLYGQEYTNAYPLLMVISLTAALASTQNMLGNVLVVLNRMWQNLFANILWGCAFLLLAYWFLQNNFNALGVCIAAFSAYFIKFIFVFLSVYQAFRKKGDGLN